MFMFRYSHSLLLLLTCVIAGAGCDAPQAKFRRYSTFRLKSQAETDFTAVQWQDIDETLEGLFGTPDHPALPGIQDDEADISKVLDLAKLKSAAGPVASDEHGVARGLYREHCVHCHGVTGDGNGPTAAFLNPYPRDYRPGKFKFKSTPVGFRPTHSDLKQVVVQGIPGTAMPSFKLLLDSEVEALVHYVKYLAIRGEVERKLIYETSQLEEKVRLVDVNDKSPDQAEKVSGIKTYVKDIVAKWQQAEAAVVEVPSRPAKSPEELVASQKRGRALFYGTVANCVKCHGDSALGDGQAGDFDEWVKEFVDPNKPGDADKIQAYVGLGLPEPRNIKPRNLRQGVFRGGLRPVDIFWRIRNGIEGTPMPAATLKPEGNPHAKGLTTDDIWDLVNYVQQLPYEPLSQPPHVETTDLRERL